jgi:hypothetical protein
LPIGGTNRILAVWDKNAIALLKHVNAFRADQWVFLNNFVNLNI